MANSLAPYRGSFLTGGGALDDINQVRPDLSPILLANQENLFSNPRNLAGLAAYRALGDDDKTSGMKIIAITDKLPSDETLQYMTRIQELGATVRTAIKTEGAVEINRKMQSSESWREFLRQVGAYARVRLEQKEETKRTRIREYSETERIGVHESAETDRTLLHENAETERTRIVQAGAYAIQQLKVHADVRIMEEYVRGQIHLSDNQLRAVHIEATAARDVVLGAERIRAATQRKISQDRLTGMIREAEFKYLTEMGKAEYLWRIEKQESDEKLLRACLNYHSELFRAQLEYQVELAKTEERRERNARKVFESFYRFLEKSVDLDKIMKGLSESGRKVKGINIEASPLDPDFKFSLRIDE